jgi:hypothetical protein
MATTKITNPNLFDLSTVNTALRLPNGSTATRPTSPSQGEWRFNTDLKYVEFYDGNNWRQIDTEVTCTTNTVDYPTTNTAYYKLDSSVADQTTNNNDGTPTDITYCNGQEYSQGGIFNGSTSFFTSNVSVPTNWTVSIWIKRSPSGYFGGTTNSSVRSGVYFYSNSNGSLLVYNRNSSGGNIDTLITSTGLVAENTWTHVGITFDSTSGTGLTTCYINGVSAGTLNGTPTHSTAFTFGRSGDYAVEYFNGKIDQIRIFSSTLTSDQITELYTEVQCPCTTNTVDEPTTNVAYYKLDGNANDSTTSANNGTWSGTEAYEYGPYGIAGSFNGTNSKITVPAILSSSYTGSVSFSVWFNMSNSASNIYTIINSDDTIPVSGKVILLAIYGGVLELTGYNFATFTTAGTTNVADGSWHNVIVVLDNSAGTFNVYLDGNSTAEITHTNTLGTNLTLDKVFAEDWNIGAQGGIRFFDGSIDQVRIFNTALSATQITSLYDEVYCNTVSTLNILNEGTSSCLALYELEDNANSTDSSGNDATEYNTVAYGGGQYKKGIIFNGSNNGVNLPSILPANSTADSSFTCWFNTSDTSGAQQTIVNAWNGSTTANNGGYALFKDVGNVLRLVNYYLDSTASGIDGSTNIGDGNWHFVAVVFDYSAGTLTLYLDGSIELKPDGNPLQITGLTPGTVNPFNGGAELGYQKPGGNIRFFPGTIDQVRIFNKALSETERLQVYTE